MSGDVGEYHFRGTAPLSGHASGIASHRRVHVMTPADVVLLVLLTATLSSVLTLVTLNLVDGRSAGRSRP